MSFEAVIVIKKLKRRDEKFVKKRVKAVYISILILFNGDDLLVSWEKPHPARTQAFVPFWVH
jgi:hypothetical protein